MNNLQRVGGKVEVAKELYFKANPWMNGMTDKAKYEVFCEWCDRECNPYYEVYFDDNFDTVFKYPDFSSVIIAIKGITPYPSDFENPIIQDFIKSKINSNGKYSHKWVDEYGDEHKVNVVAIYD